MSKIAFIVSNEIYDDLGNVKHAIEDGKVIVDIVETKLDFTQHIFITNTNKTTFLKEFNQFLTIVPSAQIILFFYVGHVIHHNGTNYLLPKESKIGSTSDIIQYGINLDSLIEQLKKVAKKESQFVFLLDGCHESFNVPKDLKIGIPYQRNPPPGFILSFASSIPSKQIDLLDHGISYTQCLKKHLISPSTPIEEILRNVRKDVILITDGEQHPFDISTLTENVILTNVSKTKVVYKPITYYIQRGWDLLKQQKYHAACREFEIAIQVDIQNGFHGSFSTACREIKKCIEFDPNFLNTIKEASTKEILSSLKIMEEQELEFKKEEERAVVFYQKQTQLLKRSLMDGPLEFNTLNIKSIPIGHKYRVALLSPDGKYFITAELNSIRVTDAKSGDKVKEWVAHSKNIISLSMTPDCKLLATGSHDETVKVWDFEKNEELLTIPKTTKLRFDFPQTILLSTGGVFIYISGPLSFRVWNLSTKNEFGVLNINNSEITCAKFSSDGKLIASGSKNCLVKIWNAKTGEILHSFNHSNPITCVAFTPDDSKLIVSGGVKISVYDVLEGKLIGDLKGHIKTVTSICTSRNGKFVISCAHDNTVNVYSLEDLKLIQTIPTGINPSYVFCNPEGDVYYGCSITQDFKLLNQKPKISIPEMSDLEKLALLGRMRDRGEISEDEFKKRKKEILGF